MENSANQKKSKLKASQIVVARLKKDYQRWRQGQGNATLKN